MTLEKKLTPYEMISRRRELMEEFYLNNRRLFVDDERAYWVECMRYVSHKTRGLRYRNDWKGRRK